MKRIDVLLLRDVNNLGKAGSVVKVKWGYAKNYLIPKGLALEATESLIKSYENQKKMREISMQKRKKKAEKLASTLSKEKLVFVLKTNEEGKPFGSITPSNIAQKLKEKGYPIEKNMIQSENIAEFGTFNIPIKLHPEVVAQVKVVVEPEK